MEVTDETIRDFGIRPKDVIWKKIGNHKCRVIMVDVSETVYKDYMRSIWAEQKRLQREKFCPISGKRNKWIRCPGGRKYQNCKYFSDISSSTRSVISYSSLEKDWIEPEARGSLEDDIIYEVLLEELIGMLIEINPVYGKIFHLLYDEYTQKEIAEEFGTSSHTISEHVKKIREALKPAAKDLLDL